MSVLDSREMAGVVSAPSPQTLTAAPATALAATAAPPAPQGRWRPWHGQLWWAGRLWGRRVVEKLGSHSPRTAAVVADSTL